jgi:MFS family permease
MKNSTLGIVLAIICTVLKAVALPLETIMLPIYANDLFGEKSFNKVLGIFISVNQIGYMVGGIIVNALFDLTGSYHLALLICATVMFGVIVALQFIINSARNIRKTVESSL